jgi:tRNA-modifying protein YgfZ
VPRGAVGAAEREALASRAGVVLRPGLVLFRIAGGGRVACLQGLVTCDVQQPGDGARFLGALLTAKGMIVAPLWITRLADALLVEAPAAAATEVASVFERSLPPRLCRWEDVTATSAFVGVYGPAASGLLAAVTDGEPPTVAGRVALLRHAGAPVTAARLVERGLDGFECVLPAAAADGFVDRLAARGASAIAPALLEERRILEGFPRLGAEIDDKTLPQEVRLDELGGVSYTKGCYLGQETVARVHFRGHANRHLAGLALEQEPPPLPAEILHRGQPVGRLSSACWWEAGHAWVGLAVVRRSIAAGTAVSLAGGVATVRDLPWEPARPEAAP